jgi:hypothetical protein
MGGDVTFNNPNRPATGRLSPLAVPGEKTEPQTDGGQVAKKAKTDTLSIDPSVAQAAAGAIAVSDVRDLAKSVGAVQNEQKSIGDLQAKIQSLVPGGVQFDTEGGGHWSSQDLKGLADVLEAMSPTDRQTLSGIHVVRAGNVDLGKGGESAIDSTLGKDISSAAQTTALGAARINSDPQQYGMSAKFKDWVVHSVSWMDDIPVLNLFSKAVKAMFGQQAPERAIVLGNSGTMIPKEVWAQEIGHQVQMANRGWNPEAIAEFGKLSNWTETFNGQTMAADGIDHRTGTDLNFAPGVVKAGRTDNMVSKYAATSPVEDFAETYKTFTLDPQKLMQLAPDKFLYLNARSQRYNAAEVKGFAQQTGTDLPSIATELVLHSGLKQDTLNAIMTVNGVASDKSAIRSDAAGSLRGGDALSQIWAKVTSDAQDPAAAQKLINDPASALGDLWNKLSSEEQAILKDPTFMKSQVASLREGFAGTKSSADATGLEVHRKAAGSFMAKLLDDQGFQQALATDPAKALQAGFAHSLPSDVVAAISGNPAAVKQLVTMVQGTYDGASAADKQRFQQNLAKALPNMSPEHFSAFAASLNNPQDPSTAAKQLQKAMETGSLVVQDAGGPPNT